MSALELTQFVSFLAVNLAALAAICLMAAMFRPTWFR